MREIWFERAAYLACAAPFVADYLNGGRWIPGVRNLLVDTSLGLVFLLFVLLKRKTRLRMERVDALRETMNQAIIHDLKNPMTSIMGSIAVVREGGLPEESRGKLLDIALGSCRLQMELLETLVETSRLEFGELTPRIGEIDALPLLRSCLKELDGLAAHIGVRLIGPPEDTPPLSFRADPEMIRRVLINLLQNAAKYTPKGGAISLSISEESSAVLLEVSDTGVGIPPEQIARMFQKYYRVEGTEQSVRRGSGIGLFYARLVVEAHGGGIETVSRVGAGTAVRVRLPRAAAAQTGAVSRKNSSST